MAAASSVALREAVRKLGAPSVVLLVNRVLPAPRLQGTQPPIKVLSFCLGDDRLSIIHLPCVRHYIGCHDSLREQIRVLCVKDHCS